MSPVRIPGPLNTALDHAATRPGVVAGAAGLALTAAAAQLWGLDETADLAGWLLIAYVAVAWHVLRVRALREQVRQHAYDNAALLSQIDRLAAGDASAMTAQLRAIGESGEPR